jgi:Zn-dependent protease
LPPNIISELAPTGVLRAGMAPGGTVLGINRAAMVTLILTPFHVARGAVLIHMILSPRRDMVLVAAAGPVMNIALALVAAFAFHIVGYLPGTSAEWFADNLKNAVVLNVVLAVFNLFPLPPLDGGRILVGILPKPAAMAVARLEPFGLVILIGLLIILPMLGAQLGVNLNFISDTLAIVTRTIINVILHVTGNS